jgi:hypothetical protein
MLTKAPKPATPKAIKGKSYRGGPFGAPSTCSHSKGPAQASMPSYKRGGGSSK